MYRAQKKKKKCSPFFLVSKLFPFLLIFSKHSCMFHNSANYLHANLYECVWDNDDVSTIITAAYYCFISELNSLNFLCKFCTCMYKSCAWHKLIIS